MPSSSNPEIYVSKGGGLPSKKLVSGDLADLLVSVRDRGELLEVRKSAVRIIDLKEPRRGPLAPADASLWQFADELWRGSNGRSQGLLSAALGEQDQAREVAASLPETFAFAKVGPSDCETEASLSALWDEIRVALRDSTELVAVAYADWKLANCPAPDVIFRLASEHGFKRCLIDTYQKDGRSTVDHLGYPTLHKLHQVARQQGLWWTLAGSIRRPVVDELQALGWMPDCFGVRGDVCSGTRTTEIAHDLVQAWCQRLVA
ncbi:(5-formylfuran-3-yl)methyl phosphate synthase [Rubripirellula sp.]|nr:(5-formylfuran-3-yl)methyl phosphate synthase [Rubripirellula sp.]